VKQARNPLETEYFDGRAMYWLLWWRSLFLVLFLVSVLDWDVGFHNFESTIIYLMVFPLVCYSALRKNYWRKALTFVDPATGKSLGTPRTDHSKLLRVLSAMLVSTYLLALGIVPVATAATFLAIDPSLSGGQIPDEIVANVLLTMIFLAPLLASFTAFLWRYNGFRLEAVRKNA
jgi:hypothetical protein